MAGSSPAMTRTTCWPIQSRYSPVSSRSLLQCGLCRWHAFAGDHRVDHHAVEHAPGAVGTGREAAEHGVAFLADTIEPLQLGQRIRMIVGADIEVGIGIARTDF